MDYNDKVQFWLKSSIDEDDKREIYSLIKSGDVKELEDAFYKDLKEQNAQQQQKAAQECVKILQEDLPDWSNKLYDEIRSYAVSQGLPKEAVDQYVDPNVIKLINKARLYDDGKQVALTKKKKTAAKAKVLRTIITVFDVLNSFLLWIYFRFLFNSPIDISGHSLCF